MIVHAELLVCMCVISQVSLFVCVCVSLCVCVSVCVCWLAGKICFVYVISESCRLRLNIVLKKSVEQHTHKCLYNSLNTF